MGLPRVPGVSRCQGAVIGQDVLPSRGLFDRGKLKQQLVGCVSKEPLLLETLARSQDVQARVVMLLAELCILFRVHT